MNRQNSTGSEICRGNSGNDAARFENLVASHLLKWVQFLADGEGRDLELRYFRDRDGHEVDFVVVEGRRPILFVEAKSSDERVDRGLAYLKSKYPAVDAWQIHRVGERDFVERSGIRMATAARLLESLV